MAASYGLQWDILNSERGNPGLRLFLKALTFFFPAQVFSPIVMSCFLVFFPESGAILFLRMPRSRVALVVTQGGSSMGVASFARRVLVLFSVLLNLTSVSLHSPRWNNDDENQQIILVIRSAHAVAISMAVIFFFTACISCSSGGVIRCNCFAIRHLPPRFGA